jgi:hypothetical protein
MLLRHFSTRMRFLILAADESWRAGRWTLDSESIIKLEETYNLYVEASISDG